MGADIHMVLEQKYDDEWVGVHAYPHLNASAFRCEMPEVVLGRTWPLIRDRDYELFAKLAGVRGDGPEPCGVPEDVSQLARVQVAYWSLDGHSHSHLSLREFTKRYVTCKHVIAKAAAARLQGGEAFKDAEVICAGGYDPSAYEDGVDTDTDVRIVFWFDN